MWAFILFLLKDKDIYIIYFYSSGFRPFTQLLYLPKYVKHLLLLKKKKKKKKKKTVVLEPS
jgi:hypothetical protein